MRHKITAVIVTYNNIGMLKELLGDLAGQSRPPDETVVVDNASSDVTAAIFSSPSARLRYIRLAQNTGSAGGYRAGLAAALQESDLILTLDDDLRLEHNTLAELEKSFEELSKAGNLAVVRAVSRGGRQQKGKVWSFTWRGSLFDAAAIRKVGLPADDFIIYGEDLEYSLRLDRAGYSFSWAPSSRYLNPRLGDKKNHYFLGKNVMYYTQPFRLYYAFRNELSVYLEYHCFLRALRILLYAAEVLFWMACFDRRSFAARAKAVILGVYHGFRKIRGKVMEI